MSDLKPELIFDGRHELAEGPVWRDDSLWWVNIPAGEIHRLHTGTGFHEQRTISGNVGCLIPADDGRWLVGRDRELVLTNWPSGEITPLCEVEADQPENRFNDGKCDAAGRLWIGTMRRDGTGTAGSLYTVTSTQPPRRRVHHVGISNGLAWSPDGRLFYFTDTTTHRVDVFDFDVETGAISNRRPLAKFDVKESPDGMASDVSGNVWVAVWGAGAVVCVDGHTGRELHRISVPASQPTSCAFGGPELDELYITTARIDLPATVLSREPHAGGIFRIKPRARGLAVSPFNFGTKANSL